MIRAYALFEVDGAHPEAVDQLARVSLGGCKVLVAQLQPDEVVGHFHCEGPRELNTALAELSQVPGVRAITLVKIVPER